MKKRTRCLIAFAALLCISAVGGIYLRYFKVYHGYEPIHFSEARWATASEDERGYMCNDLVASARLNGKTEAEIISILGPPDRKNGNTLCYEVGYLGFNPKAMLVFSYTMRIQMDENSRASEIDIID